MVGVAVAKVVTQEEGLFGKPTGVDTNTFGERLTPERGEDWVTEASAGSSVVDWKMIF